MNRVLVPIVVLLLASCGKSPTTVITAASVDETKPAEKTTYVASKKSTVFHRPNCRTAAKIDELNLITFSTREDAARRHRACKVCKP